ncbi:alpha-L RNA-binding motif-containing protein [Cystobasidium minutum MCA 4210]|uniref:mitochondrial 37S ribosomal protein uS4m n=1 Tax=Cystobasidium minutum MCA 4210 TaxID=1397322 RepID=UPI0034CE0BCB|eukprot:jgi/Rhomi1/171487/fgenesh1_kg.4_\
MPANSLQKGLVRMSWGARNLYSLWRLTYDPPSHLNGKLSFKRTSLTLFQQKWSSKRMLRAYHGDWIQERRLRRRFMPDSLPPLEASTSASGSGSSSSIGGDAGASDYNSRSRRGSEASNRIPLASLMWREVEARLDVALFRACFVHSAYDARRMITQGHVKLNGKKCTDPNILLQPGDIFSLDPKEMYLLRTSNKPYQDQTQTSKKSEEESSEEGSETAAAEATSEAETQAAPAEETSNEASTSETTAATPETSEAATVESSEAGSSSAGDNADKPADVTASTDASAATPAPTTKSSQKKPKEKKPVPGLPFELPDYAAPFLFIPAYLEVSFPTCSAIYVRHPTARPGISEIPTPYDADGEVMRLGWEFYKGVGRRRRGVVDVGDEDNSPSAAMKDLYTEEGKRNWTANWEDTQLEKRHMRAVRQGRGRWAHRPL